MPEVTYAPGSVIKNRDRLWRVDAQMEDVLVATSIAAGFAGQTGGETVPILAHLPRPPSHLPPIITAVDRYPAPEDLEVICDLPRFPRTDQGDTS